MHHKHDLLNVNVTMPIGLESDTRLCIPLPKSDGLEIIGLLGHQGVGKNYIAEHIIPKVLNNAKNTVVIAFADHLKINCIPILASSESVGALLEDNFPVASRDDTHGGKSEFDKDLLLNQKMQKFFKFPELSLMMQAVRTFLDFNSFVSFN